MSARAACRIRGQIFMASIGPSSGCVLHPSRSLAGQDARRGRADGHLVGDQWRSALTQRIPIKTRALPPGSVLPARCGWQAGRSEEHTSELQSLRRISYAVFCLKKKKKKKK